MKQKCNLLLFLFALCLMLTCGGGAEETVPAAAPQSRLATGAPDPGEQAASEAEPGFLVEEEPTPEGAIGHEKFSPLNAMLGDRVHYKGHLLIAVSKEDPAKAKLSHNARAGTKLVAVELVLGCVEAERASIDPLDATLVVRGGYVFPAVTGAMADHEDLARAEIGTGEKVRGWVAFQIPEDIGLWYIKYEFDVENEIVLSSMLN
jgi:hypothetical protein